jgi:hypothetical protein
MHEPLLQIGGLEIGHSLLNETPEQEKTISMLALTRRFTEVCVNYGKSMQASHAGRGRDICENLPFRHVLTGPIQWQI